MTQNSNPSDGRIVYEGEWGDRDVPAPSTSIAAALDELTDVNTPPLYDAVNPDSLDALFSSRLDGTPRSDGHVRFAYSEFSVTVDADGSFVIERDE
ncbi:HalOD1 output domain-containing protein [Haladaptatus sp. NG-SE-30]